MKKSTIAAVLLLMFGLEATLTNAQTSASNNVIAHPIPDRTVTFNVSDNGEYLPITWGLDLAWLSEGNIRRGIAFMGADRVDIVRSSFTPTAPLVNGELPAAEQDILNQRLNIINTWLGSMNLVLNCDHPTVDDWYVGNAANWAQLIDVTTRLHQEQGHTVVTVSPFNEPDYGWGQGTINDFYSIAGILRQNSRFNNIRISGGNTLSADAALEWYNALQDRLDEGNTHQLAGSFDSYANFHQTVSANGHHNTNDELHNVMEAMVGVEYGLQTGIWWGTAELARGEFVKASDGQRLGYAEHRPNWTAASVYRSPEGKVQAFGGTSERQAVTTTYRFVSKDRDVFFDGKGPQREYTMIMPGGTGYMNGQTNAENVVNITWGDDIQPVINGRYVLVNRNSGKVMEVAGGSAEAGANLQQGTNTGATYQQWDVTPVDSRIGGDFSYFSITAAHSGMSPDVLDWSLDDGADIITWNDAKGGNQQWYLEYVEDGWFLIRNRNSAKAMDVYNSATEDGANIAQWDAVGGTNQQWRFLPVGATVEFIAPSSPSNLVASANPESVQLTWTASSENDVSGYTIYRSETANGAYNTIARNITTTSFVDNNATSGVTYYYSVKAIDNSLNSSNYSNQTSASATGSNALVAQYQFDDNMQDNSINLNHSSSYGGISFVEGNVGSGSIALNGSDAFVQLPATIVNQQEITIATWVYWNGGAAWQRIFDFGNDQSQYLFLSPSSGSGQLRFAIKNGGAEQGLDATAIAIGEWTHVAITMGTSGASMYVNGELVNESNTISISPLDFKPVLNYIGRSQYPDPLFNGNIDDFMVYNYALPASEIAALANNEAETGIVSGQIYMLESKLSGKVIDVLGADNGSQLIQYDNWNNDNQKWLLQQDDQGFWSFTPQNATTKALDVPACNFTNGTQLNIWDAFGNDCQKFQLVDMGDSYYQIRVVDGSKCVDVYGASLDNLAEIVLWDCHTGDNQQWSFINTELKSASKTPLPTKEQESIRINAFPNPVDKELSVSIDNYKGQVTVEIYGADGRLQQQVVDYIDSNGKIVVPKWGYNGLGLVKVTVGRHVTIYKIAF